MDWPNFVETSGGFILPAESFPQHRHCYLNWAINYLKAVLEREPVFGCFGLHEWAMVYRTEEIRHSQVPLRLSQSEIADVVESQGLRCTHYDAFRFFTAAAVPRNRTPLTRATAIDHDQGGCIHANMDLYKFAYAVAPYISAELIADAFDFARQARELDMRASPYDLHDFGFEPLPIESAAGREAYIQQQRQLAAMALPIRQRMLAEYRNLAAGCNAEVTDRTPL